jgi:nucleoside phosphorylase
MSNLNHDIHVNHVTRLFPVTHSLTADVTKRFAPTIKNSPSVPAIDWTAIGKKAPVPVNATGSELPKADAVVITWAGAEWAALDHVFCNSSTPLSYSDRAKGSWPGWVQYDKDLPAHADNTWTYWGYYRLVEMGSSRVLLFKSNTHLDWPGETILAQLINRLITVVQPKLILSAGTAGGAKTGDHIGTVAVVRAGTLYESGKPQDQWPDYSNAWEAGWNDVDLAGFKKLLFPIPTVQTDLESLCSQFNQFYQTNYTLAQLDPDGLNRGDAQPALYNLTPAGTALLTTDSFVVATTAGNLASFACVEMDDAIIAETCAAAKVAFGFVRNISDPVQNVALPAKVQGNWGEAVYSVYGLYTSYNGALTAWAVLDAQL